jgi:hypothetical protein
LQPNALCTFFVKGLKRVASLHFIIISGAPVVIPAARCIHRAFPLQILTESTLSRGSILIPVASPTSQPRSWLTENTSLVRVSRKAKSGERCGALRAVSLVLLLTECARETREQRESACQSAPGGSNFATQAKTPVPKCKPRGC